MGDSALLFTSATDNIPKSSVVVALVRLILQKDTEGNKGRERRDEHRVMKA